jgi:hypothetical protein
LTDDSPALGSSYALSRGGRAGVAAAAAAAAAEGGTGGGGWFGWLSKGDSGSTLRGAGGSSGAAGAGSLADVARAVDSKPRNEHEEVQVRCLDTQQLWQCCVAVLVFIHPHGLSV